jgi:hypothetical protein
LQLLVNTCVIVYYTPIMLRIEVGESLPLPQLGMVDANIDPRTSVTYVEICPVGDGTQTRLSLGRSTYGQLDNFRGSLHNAEAAAFSDTEIHSGIHEQMRDAETIVGETEHTPQGAARVLGTAIRLAKLRVRAQEVEENGGQLNPEPAGRIAKAMKKLFRAGSEN